MTFDTHWLTGTPFLSAASQRNPRSTERPSALGMFPALGTPRAELDTPALCLDLDALEANIADAVALCKQHGVGWRPHAKCHKSPDIAHRLVDAGAIGLTCAKLGEAEVFAAAGIQDLLIANMVVGPRKVARLVELRRKCDPIICLDHLDQAQPISAAMHASGQRVRAILELDLGMKRVGVAPGEGAVRLARQVAFLPGIDLVGIMGYEGHLLLIEDQAEKAAKIKAALGELVATSHMLRADGLACSIVSCGGTGSLPFAVSEPGITEVQAGGLIFMDAFYRHRCQIADFRYALTLLTTVVSRPAPDRAIIDAGRKTMNIELTPPLVLGRDDIQVQSLSAEHGTLKLAPSAQSLKIGDRLELIPGYGDLTTVLHNHFHACRGGELVDIWPLTGRGRVE
ncbi:MAG: DSD1 family PLP-dependent enzyme [Pirellulaceae bacterium]|nr:DSD1 family PLP-dependent enzyme [Pirellulaceae bacterium]